MFKGIIKTMIIIFKTKLLIDIESASRYFSVTFFGR